MSESPGVIDIPRSGDPVIGGQQAAAIERAASSIHQQQSIMPHDRLLRAIHGMRERHFHTGRIHAANLAIRSAREDVETEVRDIATAITAKREQVPVIKAFFDTTSPDSGVITVGRLGAEEQQAAESLQVCIGRVVRQGYGIGHARPLPLFDSRRTQIDSVSGNNARVAVAVLGELGLEPGDFAKTGESTDALSVMEAVTPFGVTAAETTGVSASPLLRLRYEQQGLDASLALTVVEQPPAGN